MQQFRASGDTDPGLVLERDGFHDKEGRRVCFRGVNIAGNAKLPPFRPFNEERWWDNLVSWGFNMARLTLFWEAVEPEPGRYDYDYLNSIKDMVDQAGQRGIYTLLDMHQDLYSRHLCGDGHPSWTFPEGVNPEKNDSFGGQFWSLSYLLSKDVRACFSHFFQSSQLKEHYRNAWKEVVLKVKDCPHVLGYDIMNEPSRGDIPNSSGRFENGFLKQFYQETIDAIHEVHPHAVCFVEPHVQDMYLSRLTPIDRENVVYAPHLYNPVSITLRFDPLSENMLFDILLKGHIEKARKLGTPLFIGEFGAPWTMEPPNARNRAVNDALEALESAFVDNAYWDYSIRDVCAWNEEDFSLIDEKGSPRGLEVNVRPYISRLRGWPLFQHFDCSSKEYVARFRSLPGVPPTIIRVPQLQYPGGFRFGLSDGWAEHRVEQGELWYYPGYDGCHQIMLKTLQK